MCESLANLGVLPRKTGNEILNNDVLSSPYANAYIRGLIDGDGWICNTLINNIYYRKSVGFCSSEKACTQMRDYFSLKLNCNPVSVSKVKGKNNYKINYSSKRDTETIINFLYANANFYLERKYNEAIF